MQILQTKALTLNFVCGASVFPVNRCHRLNIYYNNEKMFNIKSLYVGFFL